MKLVTPVFHFVLLFMLTAISVGMEMLFRANGWLGEYHGTLDAPTVILFAGAVLGFGLPLFWFMNVMMSRIERDPTNSPYRVLRQSALYILSMLIIINTWLFNGFRGDEGDAYMMLWLGISILAVLTNTIFVKTQNKAAVRHS